MTPSVPVPITVLIPTIGRPELLRETLDSLAACDPPPVEALVVDQSADDGTRRLCEGYAGVAVRRIASAPPNIARAMNTGLREARSDVVAITNDDCTVASDWLAQCHRLMAEFPRGGVTGRVLPAGGDPKRVPSTMLSTKPADYAVPQPWGFFPGNMAANRHELLGLGGFDERDAFRVAAEDNDLSYRWLKSGRLIRYRPSLVVLHHDWRTPEELWQRYLEYGRGQGAMYAKHLWAGDLRVLRFAAHDVRLGARGYAARLGRGRQAHTDWRQGLLRGVPAGLAAGTLDAVRELVARRRRPEGPSR